MNIPTILTLLVFLFPLAYSPGPGNTFFAAIGAAYGFCAALPALLGYHLATFIVTALIGMGMDLATLAHPQFARILSLIGSAYVFWLGIAFFKAAVKTNTTGADNAPPFVRTGFFDGVMILVCNPKAYFIIGLLFTQFLPQNSNQLSQILGIATVFTLNNLLAFIVWTLAGVAISQLFKRKTAHRCMHAAFALCLMGIGVWMLVQSLSIF